MAQVVTIIEISEIESRFIQHHTMSGNLDFLGFDLDSFITAVINCTADTIASHLPANNELAELRAYLNTRDKPRIKICVLPTHIVLVGATSLQQCIATTVCTLLRRYNSIITGSDFDPMTFYGARNGERSYPPDLQAGVRCEYKLLPNFVLEAHCRSSETMSQFSTYLRDYINYSPGVMISVGIKIYNERNSIDFSAVCVVYERNVNAAVSTDAAVATHLVSFGSQALLPESRNDWEELAKIAMTGVGIGDHPDCTKDTAVHFTIPLQGSFLLSTNNSGIFHFSISSPYC